MWYSAYSIYNFNLTGTEIIIYLSVACSVINVAFKF